MEIEQAEAHRVCAGGLAKEPSAGGRLAWEAVGRTLGSALGPPEKGRTFLVSHLHHDRGITALDGAGHSGEAECSAS
ncbi:hypothetical protein [Actinomadura xylanilytica]|uniref:hypothetical protein n=1 Tax=Actinomadura xylanilytica TaxID=887459 RepID=UPI00255AC0B8|nr:hypothetical protein [Actinomadura xylanilytica]MDL4776881.1 hypothetical protein [Actinomadura xylanilytica]